MLFVAHVFTIELSNLAATVGEVTIAIDSAAVDYAQLAVVAASQPMSIFNSSPADKLSSNTSKTPARPGRAVALACTSPSGTATSVYHSHLRSVVRGSDWNSTTCILHHTG